MSTTTRLLGDSRRLQRELVDLGRRWECDRLDYDGLPHKGWLHHNSGRHTTALLSPCILGCLLYPITHVVKAIVAVPKVEFIALRYLTTA